MSVSKRFNLVSFDADQTLFDFARVMFLALDRVSQHLKDAAGISVSGEQLQARRNEISAEFEDRAIDMLWLRRRSFESVIHGHGHAHRAESEQLADACMEIFQELRFGTVFFYPTVVQTLKTLSQVTEVALITNGNSDPAKAGISSYFDYILLGENYAYKKPDGRIFAELMRRAGIRDPSTVVHVGDSLANDVHGANEAGMESVWFNPDGLRNDTDIAPNHEIRKMAELLEIVGASE